MDDAKFNRLAQALSTILTRRGTVAIVGAAGMLVQRTARASQLVPATCGEEGAVCTLIVGCCDGLTCVTSAINTSYGVCVPGEGGMVSTGTTLISPFSEFAVDEATALLAAASIEAATDPLAARKARSVDARARRDPNQAARRARLDARRAAKRTPDGTGRLRPRLKLKLIHSFKDDPRTEDPTEVPAETVEVTNIDDVNIVLTRIEPLLAPEDGVPLTTSPSDFTLSAGETYFFVSGLPTEDAADADDGEYQWLDHIICDDAVNGQGYRLLAALSLDTKNYRFTVLCDKALGAGAVESASETPGRKRKRNDRQQKKKR